MERGRKPLETQENRPTGKGGRFLGFSTKKPDVPIVHISSTWNPQNVVEGRQWRALMLEMMALMVSLKAGSVRSCCCTLFKEWSTVE